MTPEQTVEIGRKIAQEVINEIRAATSSAFERQQIAENVVYDLKGLFEITTPPAIVLAPTATKPKTPRLLMKVCQPIVPGKSGFYALGGMWLDQRKIDALPEGELFVAKYGDAQVYNLLVARKGGSVTCGPKQIMNCSVFDSCEAGQITALVEKALAAEMASTPKPVKVEWDEWL